MRPFHLLKRLRLGHRPRRQFILTKHRYSSSMPPPRRSLFRLTPFRILVIGTTGTGIVYAKKVSNWIDETSNKFNLPLTTLTNYTKMVGDVSASGFAKMKSQLAELSISTDMLKSNSSSNVNHKVGGVSSFFGTEVANAGKKEGFFKSDKDETFKEQLKQQKEIERLEKENKELRKIILESESGRRGGVKKSGGGRSLTTNLVDMYSEILEELMEFDSSFDVQDHLPRVVVVGDQSAGKTSVLEMVVQARIFPRGSGEMMTRCPVMVTLSEGPYHIAQFRDSNREFNLTDKAQLKSLRQEIELRMKSISKNSNKTIASEIISLNVKGPGLQRMVLVDLPGIINIETTGMAENTKREIERLSKKYMGNRNAIILCVQDGSVDAERSLVTDLVSSVDPTGGRTVFVMTKVDVAEQNAADVSRIRSILEGKRFPMKARGYFAVVTGTGRKTDDEISSIKSYEEDFFSKSQLLKSGIKRSQLTTHNLTVAVSECFWQMVKASIEQEADSFKAKLFNLESQWKNKFAGSRELDRDGLFEKAKYDILDEILELGNVNAKHWDEKLYKSLFDNLGKEVFEKVYFPVLKNPDEDFSTLVDIQLHRWAERSLPLKSVEVAQDVLLNELFSLWSKKSNNRLFEPLRNLVKEELKGGVSWDSRAPDSLRHIQAASLQDKSVPDNQAWKNAAAFMEKVLLSEQKKLSEEFKSSLGPGIVERWTSWKYVEPDEQRRRLINSEIDVILKTEPMHDYALNSDELTAIRKNISLRDKKMAVDNTFIQEVWNTRYKMHVVEQSIARCKDCKTFFYHYQRGFKEPGLSCDDIVLFWRLQKTLETTVQSLRQHILNSETKRLDEYIKNMLDNLSTNSEEKRKLITGKQVELAEQLKKVRSIYNKLENFAAAVKEEK